jgi:hypothetical protein
LTRTPRRPSLACGFRDPAPSSGAHTAATGNCSVRGGGSPSAERGENLGDLLFETLPLRFKAGERSFENGSV